MPTRQLWDIESRQVDSRKKEENQNVTLIDKYEGKLSIKTVNNYLYLGNTVQSDGSNSLTINERVKKGQSAAKLILQILEGIYLADNNCEAYKLLRNSNEWSNPWSYKKRHQVPQSSRCYASTQSDETFFQIYSMSNNVKASVSLSRIHHNK